MVFRSNQSIMKQNKIREVQRYVENTSQIGKLPLSAYWNPLKEKQFPISKSTKLATYACWRTKCTSLNGDAYPQKENLMNNTGRTILVFLTGLGIGAGLAVLFAPRSGEETREWIADTAERKFKVLRRVGRRSFRQLQDAVAEGEEKVTGVLRNSKKALASVAAKLD